MFFQHSSPSALASFLTKHQQQQQLQQQQERPQVEEPQQQQQQQQLQKLQVQKQKQQLQQQKQHLLVPSLVPIEDDSSSSESSSDEDNLTVSAANAAAAVAAAASSKRPREVSLTDVQTAASALKISDHSPQKRVRRMRRRITFTATAAAAVYEATPTSESVNHTPTNTTTDDEIIIREASEDDTAAVQVQVFIDVREQPLMPLWYTPEELRRMKQSAKLLCRQRRELELILNDTYFTVSKGTTTKTEAPVSLPAPQQQLTPLSPSPFSILNAPFFLEQRGMERWSSQRQAVSRGLTILEVKTEVFLAQASQEKLNPTELSSVCQAASLPAVRFARFLGELDEIVARSVV